METPVKLLVVEDEMILAADMAMKLTNLGYDVTGIVARGDEAIRYVTEHQPDIVLLDINLKGSLDGIETAHQLHQLGNVPIIYVTANADDATFARAKATHPYAFISKPVRTIDLQRAIELTINLLAEETTTALEAKPTTESTEPVVLDDRIFVRHKDRMVRIAIDDVLYVEADRNYCHIVTKTRQYTLATTLKTIEEKLSVRQFLRIHRSYMVSLTQIDEVSENYVGIGGKQLPLSPLLRDGLLRHLRTI